MNFLVKANITISILSLMSKNYKYKKFTNSASQNLKICLIKI